MKVDLQVEITLLLYVNYAIELPAFAAELN